MNTISFDKISKYLENALNDKTQELYEQNLITEDIKYKVFTGADEYFNAYTNPIESDKDRTVLVSVMNNGGLQDSSVNIDTYAQLTTIEMFALEDQRDILTDIMTAFVTDNKNKLVSIDDSAVQITIGEFPKYSKMFEAQGYHRFTLMFKVTMIIFSNANLSNLYKLEIDGGELLPSETIFSRSTTLEADLQKRNATLYFPNTTGFQIQVTGIYISSVTGDTLFNDCLSNTRFNVPYTINIKKYDSNTNTFLTLKSGSFYTKDSVFAGKSGSLMTYRITFYEGLVR